MEYSGAVETREGAQSWMMTAGREQRDHWLDLPCRTPAQPINTIDVLGDRGRMESMRPLKTCDTDL